MKCTLELWLRGTLFITEVFCLKGWIPVNATFEENVKSRELSLKIAVGKFETKYRQAIYKSGIYEIKARIQSKADPSNAELDKMTDKELLKRQTPYWRKKKVRAPEGL